MRISSGHSLPSAHEVELSALDVSHAELYEADSWRPYFERLRVEDPVHYTPDSQFGPYWSITRFEDIIAVDTNHFVYSSQGNVMIGDLGDDLPAESFIMMDPPQHDCQRQSVQPVVAPGNLAAMEPLIRGRVCEILDNLPIGETFDWVERVSISLTTQMLATLFDFPFNERNKLTYWSDLVAGSPELSGGDVDRSERVEGLMECLNAFSKLWDQRKSREPGFDLISLLQANPSTATMVDRPMEFLGTIALLIVGGNDTTRNSLTGGVLALNEFPYEYEKLRRDPSLIDSMVPEIIRWQTPLIHMRRTALKDVQFKGKQIRKGDKVVMWFISGNRDDSAINQADKFIIDRSNPRHHMSFGFGIHRCMGNRLGEMQLRITWEEILKRFSWVEVVEKPIRIKSNFVRGYSEMLVRVHPK